MTLWQVSCLTVGVWERRGVETARSGGVWWGTPEVNEASSHLKWMKPHHWHNYMPSVTLLGDCLFPVHARWCPRGSMKEVLRDRVPPKSRAARPAFRTSTPDQRGQRVRPPDSGPYLDPSLSNTAPPSRTPQHDEDIRSPVYFGHFSPLDTILLFLLNKSLSEAWFHAHRLLFPPQTPLNKHNNEGFRIQEYFSRCKKLNCTTIHMVEKMYINHKKIMIIN